MLVLQSFFVYFHEEIFCQKNNSLHLNDIIFMMLMMLSHYLNDVNDVIMLFSACYIITLILIVNVRWLKWLFFILS